MQRLVAACICLIALALAGCDYLGTIEKAGEPEMKPETEAPSRNAEPAAETETPRQGTDPLATLTPPKEGEPWVARLPNGLTVLVMKDERFPLASVRLYVRAGSAYEKPSEAGVSHVLEHMVFKGTEKRGPGEIAEAVESVGGSLNAATSFDYTVYFVDVPAEHWKLGFDVVEDMAFHQTIDAQELETEKQVVLSELERGEDSPSRRLFKTMQELVWPDTSYAWPIIGTRETVSALTRQDLIDYVNRLYQPQSMLLVAVGDIDPAEAMREAEALFGDQVNDHAIEPVMPFPEPGKGDGPNVRIERGPWNKLYIGVAFPTAGRQSAKAVGLDVLAHLVGGDQTSLLYRTLKYERQLVDEISAYSMTLGRGGAFVVSAILDADRLEEYWSTLVATLRDIDAETFDDETIARTKLNIEDSLYQSKETISGLASKLGWFQFFHGGVEAEDAYVYRLRQVSRHQLGELAEAVFTPQAFNAAVLAPEGTEADSASLLDELTSRWPAEEDEVKAATAKMMDASETISLPGGHQLVLIPDTTLPYTALSIIWPGGDGLLEPDEQGLAELSARMLTRSTQEMDAPALREYLSGRAARLSANAGRDNFGLNAKFPTRFSGDMLPLIETILTDPAFADQELELAKKELIADLVRRTDQPLGLAFREIPPFLYPEGHYGYYHLGKPEQVREFGRETLVSYWERQWRRPFVLAVCGDFERSEIEALARSLAEAAPGTDDYLFVEPTLAESEALRLALPDRNQSHVMKLFPVPGQSHPDTAGLYLLRDILSGQSGLLFRELRDEQGLGYTVTAFDWQAPQTGFFALYIGTTPEQEDEALEGFAQIIDRLQGEPLPAEEIERAKNILLGDYYRDHQSLLSRAREASGLMARGFPRDYSRELIDAAMQLDAEDVMELARTYLRDEASYLVTVRPGEGDEEESGG
jgi:zinc protease